MKDRSGDAPHVWTVPALIAIATMTSLVGALVADGLWDALAAGLLFAVLAFAAWLSLKPR